MRQPLRQQPCARSRSSAHNCPRQARLTERVRTLRGRELWNRLDALLQPVGGSDLLPAVISLPLLHRRRLGQDLSNVGVRLPDAKWHYVHLYHPSAVCEGSLMPSFSNLFVTCKIQGQRSDEALELTGADAPKEGYEVVPTAEAKNLVAYLLALRHDYPLPEAPVKKSGSGPAK